MRTKALIGAAIAMAAGLLSASAQVYSVNVVGYVNTVTPAGQYDLIATPLDDGTNRLADLLPTVPIGTSVQIWTSTGFSAISKKASGWSTNVLVPPGTGYFIKTAAAFTNTFVGNVDCAPGGGQTNVALSANLLQLVGSKVPFSGLLSDSGTNTLNFGPAIGIGSQVQVWTPGSGFQVSQKKASGWVPNETISVGEGFFVKPNAATTWTQTLQ